MIARIKEKPFLLLLLFACVFLVCGFIPTDKTIDIQLHDFYWVFGENHIFIAGCFIFYFLFGLHLLFKKILYSKRLIWIHVLTTIAFTLLIVFITKTISFFTPIVPKRYYTFNEIDSFKQYAFFNDLISVFTIIIFFTQFIFLINIIAGILKKSYPSK
ncbi:MAG: cbb3-type cytochrome c oxidase subunit I [Chitinophagales bacterium]|nr:cbb3-type cytochrome c oxidase subunit I [Chitinophagales bacterium]